jgi:hypothetical protein
MQPQSKMDAFFGTQNTIGGAGLSARQKVALTIMIVIAIVVVVMWWVRTSPKDVVYLGPVDVGPGKAENPEEPWIALMDADQIVKTTGNNMTCSFFVYINASSINQVPINYDGSFKLKYLLTVGNTIGVTVNPAKQMCTIDVLQSAPHSSRGRTIAVKDGLRMDGEQVIRTFNVAGVYASKWNQITICVEGRSIDVYLNGKLANSAIMDNVPMSAFSGLKLNESPDFDGQVCLFQMWKQRRTGKEVLENYQKHTDLRGKPNVPDPELTFSGAWDRFLKASCEKTGLCGFPVKVGPMEYVEYEFA